ncbi:MAG TPA: DUF370 domain-containing protein [Desulfosalsimonadaceae bacterium]|nr:DUF370 domain-containing protein [Desulfosalsimonadaceae bacterium]
MSYNLLSIGFGSNVVADEVLAIVSPNSAPMRRLKEDAREEGRLLDATFGRRTRSIILMKNNYVVLSAIQSETIAQRFAALNEKGRNVSGAGSGRSS